MKIIASSSGSSKKVLTTLFLFGLQGGNISGNLNAILLLCPLACHEASRPTQRAVFWLELIKGGLSVLLNAHKEEKSLQIHYNHEGNLINLK